MGRAAKNTHKSSKQHRLDEQARWHCLRVNVLLFRLLMHLCFRPSRRGAAPHVCMARQHIAEGKMGKKMGNTCKPHTKNAGCTSPAPASKVANYADVAMTEAGAGSPLFPRVISPQVRSGCPMLKVRVQGTSLSRTCSDHGQNICVYECGHRLRVEAVSLHR